MKINLPGGHHEPEPHVEASRPHAFVRIDDPGIMAMAAGGGARGSAMGGVTSVVVTDNVIRKSRCGVPGCGRERSDEIHAVAED